MFEIVEPAPDINLLQNPVPPAKCLAPLIPIIMAVSEAFNTSVPGNNSRSVFLP